VEDDPASGTRAKEVTVPPHWFVPVRSSDAKQRRTEVETAIQGHGKLGSFWRGSDGNLYALINDCPTLDQDEKLKRNLKVSGPLIGLEQEVR
jgi:hypothetical protein